MTTGADILPGHAGMCHRAPGFTDPELERVAHTVEKDYAQRFLAHRIVFRIVPIVIDFRARIPPSASGRASRFRRRTKDHVGEGVAVRIDTAKGYPGEAPEWLTDAEADMIVRERSVAEKEWMLVHPLDKVESYLRGQADAYLRELALTHVWVSRA